MSPLAQPLAVRLASLPHAAEEGMARSKSKQKIKRHLHKQKRLRRIKRKKVGETES
jgi:hypothetical protein